MDEKNPYASPHSRVDEIPVAAIEVPEEITKHIRYGWIAATISGTLTLVVTLISLSANSDNSIFNAWTFIDVALIAGMAFGIYRKSRIAATLMLVYFLISKIIIMMKTGQPSGLVLGIVFSIFYFRAMLATFQYHRFIKHAKRFPPAPKPRLSDDPFFQPGAPSGE